MNTAGLHAFQSVVRKHRERRPYDDLTDLIVAVASRNNMHLRVDAIHFLAVNLETMVIEPLAEQRGDKMSVLEDMKETLESDIERIISDSETPVAPAASVTADLSARDDDQEMEGLSSNAVLKATAKRYDTLQISSWRLWGGA